MALINTTDLQHARDRLTPWLAARLSDATDVSVGEVTTPTSSGLSNELLMFDASWTQDGARVNKGLVGRVEPVDAAVFPTYDLDVQARLMSTLAQRTAVPAPAVIGLENDPTVLGARFMVMERAPGQAPSDDPPYTVTGWVSELSPAQRSTLWDNALRQLADIHALDWKDLGLGFVDLSTWGKPGADQQLDYLDYLSSWVMQGRAHPTVDAALDWLRGNRPSETGPIVLSWGDARPGNMLFDDSLSVTAVLDWEMASLAVPEIDLGLWLFMQRHHTEGIGVPLPDGVPDHVATADRYEKLSGYRPRDLHYYEALAATRGSIIMARFADLMTAAGLIPPDSGMWTTNPATQLLAAMLEGLPAPDGRSSSWIGQRA